jgi:SPX domain protein involved in polyphosphate accumulation
MPNAQEKPVTFETLNSTKLIVGAIVGVVVMYWAFNDRIATRVEEEVTLRVSTATKLARMEERLFACEQKQNQYENWQRTHTDRLNAAFQLIGKKADDTPTPSVGAQP